MGVTDKKGLVKENNYLVCSFPQWSGIVAYWIYGRANAGFEEINYGPLNIAGINSAIAGVSDGGTSSGAFSFNWNILPQEFRADMFWYDRPERLLHIKKLDMIPYQLRKYMWLTTGVQQANYLQEAPAQPATPSDFGFWRGSKELVVLPYMHIQFEVANMTNMNLYTYAKMVYGEYLVQLVTDPKILWELMNRKGDYATRNAYWFTFPGQIRFVKEPFERGYGIQQPIPISRNLEQVMANTQIILAGGRL